MPEDNKSDLEDADKSLWQRVIKTVRPMKPIDNDFQDIVEETVDDEMSFADLLDADIRPKRLELTMPESRKPKSPLVKKAVKKTHDDMAGDDIDRRTLERLKRGKLAISASLDLHGMTQDTARHRVKEFIKRHFVQQHRVLLIITGKGRFSPLGIGVLKKQLPAWLKEPDIKQMVLKAVPARQKDGGGGAFYVYLRRKRS